MAAYHSSRCVAPSHSASIVASHCARDAIAQAGVGEQGAEHVPVLRGREPEVGHRRLHVALLARRPLGVGVLLERGTHGADELVVHPLLDHAAKVAGRATACAPRLDGRAIAEPQIRRARPR